MDYRDFEHIGSEIRDLVQSAIDSQDFSRLNSAINQTLDSARQAFRSAANPGNSGCPKGSSSVRGSSFSNYDRSPKASDPRFAPAPKGRIAGPLLTCLGFSLAGIFGLSTLLLLLTTFLAHAPSETWIATIMMLCFFVMSLIVGGVGRKKWNLVKRFRNYKRILGNRTYCSLEELSQLSRRKIHGLRSDLNLMIEKGMFPQGHLDRQGTCFMLTDDVFQQYCAAEQELARRQREASVVQMPEENQQSDFSPECQRILEEGNDYIQHIHYCNDILPGAEISRKLDRLETIMRKIFDQVKKEPDLAPELHKLMNYYLPTTRKLLDAYCQLDAQPVTGENMTGTKLEIECTLDTINEAFENLLDRFFEDTAWDISSDISVMKTMLAQEGLTDDPLTKAGKERDKQWKTKQQ